MQTSARKASWPAAARSAARLGGWGAGAPSLRHKSAAPTWASSLVGAIATTLRLYLPPRSQARCSTRVGGTEPYLTGGRRRGPQR
jgi:hypothetical protein